MDKKPKILGRKCTLEVNDMNSLKELTISSNSAQNEWTKIKFSSFFTCSFNIS